MQRLAHQDVCRNEAAVEQHCKEEEERQGLFQCKAGPRNGVRRHRGQEKIEKCSSEGSKNRNLVGINNRFWIVENVLKCIQVDFAEEKRVPLCAD